MTTDLVPVASPLPLHTGAEMERAFVAYRDIQGVLDRSLGERILEFDGKRYRTKAYWLAISVAFNVSVELVAERREVFGADDFAYLVTYRASMRDGRAQTGDGACSAAEKSKGRMRATEHNVRSHAHTRARNRAISNLVGFGEVSAEELESADVAEPSPARVVRAVTATEEPDVDTAPPVLATELPPKRQASGTARIVYIVKVTSTKTKRPGLLKYTIHVQGDPSYPANETTVSTINPKWGKLAEDCRQSGAAVKISSKRTDFGLDLASIERVDDQGNPLPLTDSDIPFR